MSEAQQILDWMRKTFGYRIRKEVYDAIERGDWRPDAAAQPPEAEVRVCTGCGKSPRETRKFVALPHRDGWICGECVELAASICEEVAPLRDPKDLALPKTTQEFAQWLRDIAAQVDRIPDRPLQLDEGDVEVGFYYGNPMFPQKPTGLHFAVDFASTEYGDVLRRQRGGQR